MANNKSGFDNEDKIRNALNNKSIEELNENLQDLIKYSFRNYDGIIKCEKQGGQNKSDLIIKIKDEEHTFSIKSGSGNSIHQEPLSSFISYLESFHSLLEPTKKNILFFIWGDLTYDGKGIKSNRMDNNEIKKEFPEICLDITSFFSRIRNDLIKRFIFDGSELSKYSCEFIYYGTEEKGVCCSSEKIFNWLNTTENGKRSAVPIGSLSFQSWNRAIKADCVDKTEQRRNAGNIQIKWSSLYVDMLKARDE